MKKIILTVFLLSTLFMACRKSNGPAVFDLGVDLQHNFTGDDVQVYIDGQTLYNNQATTNDVWRLAGSIGTTNSEGKHSIKVVVNGSTVTSEDFEQHSNLYIGIAYDQSLKKVSFVYSPKKFIYD